MKTQRHPLPPLITNRQVNADGSSTQHELRQDGDHFILVSDTGTALPTRRSLCLTTEGVDHALQHATELLMVGVGLTDITTTRGVDTHTLLGLLIVDAPDASEPDPELWSQDARLLADDLGVDIDEWHAFRDQICTIRVAEGYTLVPRWIRIDEERAFVLTGPDFTSVGLLDPESDWNRPGITMGMLSWSFYRESGAPVTWDGHAELGWCGPRMWSFTRRGDIDPDELVVPAPSDEYVAQELAEWILTLGWEMGYLTSTVGLPGLTDEDRRGLNKSDWVEGDDVTSDLPAELDEAVMTAMCQRHPALQAAVDGLRNPASERGRLIYSWVRQIAHGPVQSGSWDHVHAAMLGNIEPPADDQHAPTMQERWANNMERASAVIREATGQPEPLPTALIPDGLEAEVHEASRRHTSTQLRDAIAAEERAATLIDDARHALGVQPGQRGLFTQVTALVEQFPEDEQRGTDLWSSYWMIRDWDSGGGDAGHDDYIANLRDALGKAEQSERTAGQNGWPSSWPVTLMTVWVRHGGTMRSAQAWATAGWSAADILTQPNLSDTWNPGFDERLTLTDPPPHTTPRKDF